MHLRPIASSALLAEVGDPARALALATWARSARIDAVEVVPAAESVLFDGVPDVATLAARLREWRPTATVPAGDLVEIRIVYDGPDLAFVADAWDTDVDGVIERHAGVEFVSAFCGFAPGFAYLSGLPAELAVPRLDSPRPRVPAGSIALAGTWCGAYPTASPGGWRLLGRTEALLWDPDRTRPALLAPGTRVRFVSA